MLDSSGRVMDLMAPETETTCRYLGMGPQLQRPPGTYRLRGVAGVLIAKFDLFAGIWK